MRIKTVLAVAILFIIMVAADGIPHKTHAQTSASAVSSVPVGDVLNYFYHYSNYSKEYILDKLANIAIKQISRQLTESLVNWISNGFNGSPSFVQNPEQFFQGIGDNVVGQFVSASGPLASLCSPISLNVRLAIALSQSKQSSQYSCTLSQIIKNVKGATINGFNAGDFSQGGWPAFVQLSQPQNSFNGAYLQSLSDVSLTVNNKTEVNKQLLNQGSGFLSFSNCTGSSASQGNVSAADVDSESGVDENGEEGQSASPSAADVDDPQNVPNAPAGAVTSSNCSIETPGSYIQGKLNTSADSPLRQLDVGDSIDDLINGVLGALFNEALTKGLAAVGGNGSNGSGSGSSNYLSELEAEAQANDAAVIQQAGQSAATGVSSSLAVAQSYKNYVDSSLSVIQTASSSYAATVNYCTSVGDSNEAALVQSQITTTIAPLLSQLMSEDATATIEYQNEEAYVNGLNSATSSNAVIDYAGNVNSYALDPSIVDAAHNENVQDTSTAAGLTLKQTSYMQACQRFAAMNPNATSTSP